MTLDRDTLVLRLGLMSTCWAILSRSAVSTLRFCAPTGSLGTLSNEF